MAVDECKVCCESVSATCSGVVCEMCDRWLHTACVGLLKASSKMLNHRNIVFLCDGCLEDAKERLKDTKEKTDAATQTKTSETSCRDTQTEDAHAGVTQTVYAQQPQDKAIQTERVSEQQQQQQQERRGPTKKRMVLKKSPICIVGDSMIRNTGAHLRSKVSGASQECLRGVKIQDIKKLYEKTQTVENGLLVIQGGGNDLERVG